MTQKTQTPRLPDLRDQEMDPALCEVMPGHQHAVVDVEELADSLVTLGQLNPVQVIQYPDGRRFVVAGRRRWTACKLRKLPMRADVWLCKGNEDVNTENLARAMRIAENTERCDPSAIDVAFQLRSIRNEKNFGSAAELAAYMGMHESRVKRYLCVLQASDLLLETAPAKSSPIRTVAELMRCEKSMGEQATRKYIKQAGEGTITATDLKRMRDKVKASKSASRKLEGRDRDKELRRHGNAFLASVAKDPTTAAPFVEAVLAELVKFVEEGRTASKSSPA